LTIKAPKKVWKGYRGRVKKPVSGRRAKHAERGKQKLGRIGGKRWSLKPHSRGDYCQKGLRPGVITKVFGSRPGSQRNQYRCAETGEVNNRSSSSLGTNRR